MDTTFSKEAEKMLASGEASAIDVRSPGEFATGHIAGAKNIDINGPHFEDEVKKLDVTKRYIVYCQMGGRSARASSIMRGLGFTNAMNLSGGIAKWKEDRFPIEK